MDQLQSLPLRGLDRRVLESAGFIFGDVTPDKHLIACIYPPGWTNRPCDEPHYWDLLDAKGRLRAKLHYRPNVAASITHKRRYYYDLVPVCGWQYFYKVEAAIAAGSDQPHPDVVGIVRDRGDQDRELYRTPEAPATEEARAQLEALCMDWLRDRFPNWPRFAAYWEDAPDEPAALPLQGGV